MKFSPIQSLWLLVAIQALLLLLLLAAHFWTQSQNSQLLDQRRLIQARLPEALQKIQQEPDPEKIRSEALRLLELADQGNQTVVVMTANLQKMTDAVGLIFFIVTVYLAVCVYKLRRQDQNAADILK
jgi:hypothetical protein